MRRALAWLLPALVAAGCSRPPGPVVISFWGMGREGEVVAELMRDFELKHPGIRVKVQQVPWSAAHEKLLTAFVGRATPDLSQLGNTWIPEFAALKALEPLDAWVGRSPAVSRAGYHPGIWDTNVIDGRPYGVPWYVDTRLLFYRRDILARAGCDSLPATWDGWRSVMERVKRHAGPGQYAVFLPVNEWAQPAIFGLQAGSPLLDQDATRGAFSSPLFRKAFDFYIGLFRDGLAPPVGNNDIANLYQEFARGTFAMYITGPWNLGEFRRRLPAHLEDAWSTAPLPGPVGPGASLAGGSSLVLWRHSKRKAEAWKVLEYLSEPAQQLRFYELTGDLPARVEAWRDPRFQAEPRLRAFGEQLARAVPTPKVPEWELIATRLQETAEAVVRGAASPDSGLARLDREVWRILEKRRWLAGRPRESGSGGGGS